MTKDELVEKLREAVKDVEVAGANVVLDAQLAAEEIDEIIRAALAIAMPAAFEMAAEVAEKRAEARFADFGTTEPDTNASYYSGRRGEALDELDEEDGDIAKALRELKEKWK